MSMTLDTTQDRRAAKLRDLFEPWSLRKLETKTGIGRGTLEGRFNGTTPLNVAEIEALAPLIRMTPAELFGELLEVECTPRDLNPEPTGYGTVRPIPLHPRKRSARDRPGNRTRNTAPKGRAA